MGFPEFIELNRVDFVTIDAIGPPGKRTFYLQAGEDDLVVTMVIEKEHAIAISIAVDGVLERLGGSGDEPEPTALGLVRPVEPLFRVGQLGLGYDEDRDMLIIVAEELTVEEEQGTEVHIWASRAQMAALARKAADVSAAGRPVCSLCGEPIEPGERHVCVRGNGRKHLYDPGEA
jgi:uncharacterized repeat protein (TIGR03847 family)